MTVLNRIPEPLAGAPSEIVAAALGIAEIAAQKAVASQAEPERYPLPSEADSFEQIFLARFNELPPQKQHVASAHALSTLDASLASAGKLGASVDLGRAVSIETRRGQPVYSTPEQLAESELAATARWLSSTSMVTATAPKRCIAATMGADIWS